MEQSVGAIVELGDIAFAPYVRRWRVVLADCPAEGYGVLVDAITERQASRLGVVVDDWMTSNEVHLERARALLDKVDADGLGALWDEPHTLGWLHQHFGEVERDASNQAHTRDEEKHTSGTVTTQLYTPRWIADFLAKTCLDTLNTVSDTMLSPTLSATLSVCDPAVGGGQMLLSVLDELVARGADAGEVAGRLHGVDLDARAVELTRRSLALAVARHVGGRDEAAEAAIWSNVTVADGLFDDIGEFDVVITNPPYMGSRSMPAELKERIRATYRPFHADLYTAFIRRCHEISTHTVGILAQQTVWFESRFKKARSWLLDEAELVSFMHLGAHAFANLGGEKASVVAFVQKKKQGGPAPTEFIDLRQMTDAGSKREAFVERGDEHTRYEPAAAFDALPGRVVAHWLPTRLRAHFDGGRKLADIADIPGSQNKTGKNRRYVKDWRDVDPSELRCAPEIIGDVGSEDGRWVFYSKGGRYAPWWGNWQNVVDWSDEARQFYADNRTSNLLGEEWWFKPGICYTDFGGRTFNARLMPAGCVFDMAGPAIFPHAPDDLYVLLAVLNSTPVRALLNAMNPSLHYQVRDLRNLPVPEWSDDVAAELAELAHRLVDGMKLIASFTSESPCSLLAQPVRAQPVRAQPVRAQQAQRFASTAPILERRIDELVCQLYERPPVQGAKSLPSHHLLCRFNA